MKYVFIFAGLALIIYGAFLNNPHPDKTTEISVKSTQPKKEVVFKPTVFYSRYNENVLSLLSKYYKLPKRQGADLNRVILKEKTINRDAKIDSLRIKGMDKFRVLIDGRGWPEAVILMRPLHPYPDSLAAEAIKRTKFQSLLLLNRPSKYFISMGYAFNAGTVFYPVVFNPVSARSLAHGQDENTMEYPFVTDKPVLIKKAKPVYPDLARKAQIKGTVVVTITIGITGQVENAQIIKSVPMLDAAALNAAYRCKFKPAKFHDKAVRVRMNIPFRFELK